MQTTTHEARGEDVRAEEMIEDAASAAGENAPDSAAGETTALPLRQRARIMLVDDSPTNLAAGKAMLKELYEVYTLPSAIKMFEVLDKTTPDLILLDIEMPEMNGYEAIAILKEDRRYHEIPVIFLTAKADDGSEMEGLSLGAEDYVRKPFSPPLLIQRIKNQLKLADQYKQLARFNDKLKVRIDKQETVIVDLEQGIITAMAELVECRDSVTGGHIVRTQKYMELMIKGLIHEHIYESDIAQWDVEAVLTAAQLHDIGKISTPDAILNKPGKLTTEEFLIMQEHPAVGAQIIRGIQRCTNNYAFIEHARLIAGSHHEKWDGSGYPEGLSKRAIPLEGRLMAFADVYDALVTARPYKEPFSHEEAKKIILDGSGTHFDPILMGVFLEASDQFAAVLEEHKDQPSFF